MQKRRPVGSRSVVENVSEMRVAAAAEHFGARHAVAGVPLHFHIFCRDRLPVARPARAGMEFRVRTEKRLAAADAGIDSIGLGIFVFAGEGRLGSLLARHEKLFVVQLRTPLRIALLDFFAHGDSLHEFRIS